MVNILTVPQILLELNISMLMAPKLPLLSRKRRIRAFYSEIWTWSAWFGHLTQPLLEETWTSWQEADFGRPDLTISTAQVMVSDRSYVCMSHPMVSEGATLSSS